MDINQVYDKVFDAYFSSGSKIKVATDFPGQMRQIKSIYKNDTTALISTIVDFMIKTGTVDINFESSNANLTKLFTDWGNNVNKNISMDIPKGLRGFTEQYLRERWKSSFLVVKVVWGEKDGYTIPRAIYVYDGASIRVDNSKKLLNTNEYYFGKVDKKNRLKNTKKETIFIRKPYNQWYEKYPTPYLVHRGTVYHGLFKNSVLARQEEIINTAFPYQYFIKVGTQEAVRKGLGPTEPQLQAILDKFKKKKQDFDTHEFAKGLAGAFPGDVNFEEHIPDYLKATDEKILKGTDKNILTSLGMIELKGFSQNREESILNPKVMIEEVIDAVTDYTELINEIVELTREKNSGRYKMGDYVTVNPGIIESFITDDMRTMIRSLFDRGLVSYEDTLESTTPLKFKTQAIKREKERKDELNKTMYPRVTQNLEKDPADLSPENVSDDKKKGTPEAENFKNACDETELITEPMKTIRSIPEEFKGNMTNKEKQVFKKAFNEKMEECIKLEYDPFLKHTKSIEYACDKVLNHIEEGGK